MELVGNFEVDRLHYSLMKIQDNFFKLSVPTMGTAKNAFHTAPDVSVRVDGEKIEIIGLPTYHNQREDKIISEIRRLVF